MAAQLSQLLNERTAVSEDDRLNDVPADPLTRAALMKDCREYLVERMCELVAGALDRIVDELTDSALRSMSRQEQQAMMEAVALVRGHRDELASSFRQSFSDCFERRLRGLSEPVSAPDAFGELSLIDDSVLSGKLTVDRLVHRARGRLDPDEVLGMRARLAALLERDWFEENEHPAAPEAVYEALKQAVASLSADTSVQGALLDAFEPHITARLNAVYSQANQRLRNQQVMPKIRRPVLRSSAVESRASRPSAPGEEGKAGSPGMPPGGSGAGVGAAPGQGAAAAGAHLLDPGTLSPGLQWQVSLEGLGRGSPTARESVARMLTDPDSFGVADLPLPAAQPDLLQSLTHLQGDATRLAGGEPGLSPNTTIPLSALVFDRARDQGSPLDQLTVEIVSMVFDYLYADKRLGDGVKQQLLRLQVVAVKAALIDRSFFARRAHPMRQLIDRITEMATDPDLDLSADSPMMADLTALIDWVLTTFDQDLATFDEALSRLAELAQREQQRRAERLAEVTREAERLEWRARQQALAQQQLQQRCDETTPGFLKQFLNDWWSQVIAELALTEQPAPDSAPAAADQAAPPSTMRAADALQVAEALIWSVAPKLPDEVNRLAVMLPKVLQGLNRGLALIDMPAEPRQAFYNELLRLHTAAIASAKSMAPQRVAVFNATAKVRMRDGELQFQPTRILDTTTAGSAEPGDSPAEQQARARLAELVRRGDRIEIEEEGHTHRFKLAWISPSQRLFVLSRHPQDARSLDAIAFARLFDSGRARVVERRSHVDAALQQAVVEAVGSGANAAAAAGNRASAAAASTTGASA